MKPILCIGETQEEYDLGITEEVCAMQVSKDLAGVSKKDLANVVLAYEPCGLLERDLSVMPTRPMKFTNSSEQSLKRCMIRRLLRL